MPLLSRQAARLCSRLDLAQLTPRPRDELVFVSEQTAAGAPLLLDTAVYIHQLQGKTPPTVDAIVGTRLVNHSVVAMQEMLHAIGVLDPADRRTKASIAEIRGLIEAIPAHRIVAPTWDVMFDAAAYAGLLCRLQGYTEDRRMRALQDCTLLLQSRKLGFTLLTPNVLDFDLLQQLQLDCRILFYDVA